jgi:CRP-like cAMP-binding protein
MDMYEQLLNSSEEQWQRLIQLGHLKVYESDELIFMQGQPCESLFYVQEGMLKHTVYLPNGKEKVINFLKAPSVTGLSGIFDNKNNICSAVALCKTKCVIIQRDIFLDFLFHNPQVMFKFCFDFIYKTRCNLAQAEDVYVTVEKKLARFLLDSHNYGVVSFNHDNANNAMPITLSHNEIANLLGTTRQRVTQYLNEFKKYGFIEIKHKYIYVINHQLLSDYYYEL